MQTTEVSPDAITTNEIKKMQARLIAKFIDLNVEVVFDAAPPTIGPVLYVFRIKPTGRTTVSRLENMSEDIAVALGVKQVTIKRIPGEMWVAIFVPRPDPETITYIRCLQEAGPLLSHKNIPLVFGIDHRGSVVVEDLTELPHLLIAGSTGSGKSTLMGSLFASAIYTVNSACEWLISDTKNVEFQHFKPLTNLRQPIMTTIEETINELTNLQAEVSRRLHVIGAAGCRNIHEYNQLYGNYRHPSYGTGQQIIPKPKPAMKYIVFWIDELADILVDTRKDADDKRQLGKIATEGLSKVVQKSRAAGIYIIAGTQRPSVNIVAGTVKANFPARLSFRLPTEADSRTVLGEGGAEHLLSRGDMLYKSPNSSTLQRLHAPYSSIDEIKTAVAFATL